MPGKYTILINRKDLKMDMKVLKVSITGSFEAV